MARYEIIAPVPGFDGVVDGIAFTDGRAWLATADTDQTIKRFRDNGFDVVDRDAPPQPEPEAPDVAPPPTTRARKPVTPAVPADGHDTPIGV